MGLELRRPLLGFWQFNLEDPALDVCTKKELRRNWDFSEISGDLDKVEHSMPFPSCSFLLLSFVFRHLWPLFGLLGPWSC